MRDVFGDILAPSPSHIGIDQAVVDFHTGAIRGAIDTVVSLDEHYGREIDVVATRIHDAIPDEPDRSPIPEPDRTWPATFVDAITGGLDAGARQRGEELDPRTRGRHVLETFSVEFMRTAGPLLRGLANGASGVGIAVTALGGYKDYRDGKTTDGESFAQTGGAIAGGAAGGFALGGLAGGSLGPLGSLVFGAVGAAAGTPAGKALGDAAHDSFTNHHELLLEQYRYGI